jgi:hypothetical protein
MSKRQVPPTPSTKPPLRPIETSLQKPPHKRPMMMHPTMFQPSALYISMIDTETVPPATSAILFMRSLPRSQARRFLTCKHQESEGRRRGAIEAGRKPWQRRNEDTSGAQTGGDNGDNRQRIGSKLKQTSRAEGSSRVKRQRARIASSGRNEETTSGSGSQRHGHERITAHTSAENGRGRTMAAGWPITK